MKVTVYKNKHTNRALKLDLKRFCKAVGLFAIAVSFLAVTVDFMRFPECYITTLKYQLQNDLKRGDEAAIEYYRNVYIKHGRELFD